MPRACLISLVVILACGKPADSGPKPSSATAALADAESAKALPPEQYVSPTAGFDLSLPGVWKGRYRTEEGKDSTTSARLAVTFRFKPDSGSKAPSLTLMTLRVFSQAAWKAATKPGAPQIGAKLAEQGDDVFVLSLPSSNPYPTGSAEAASYDRLLISIAQGGQQVHLTPHAK